jgi:dTDP-4-amino-4,6-dideoxygalactose transaminase
MQNPYQVVREFENTIADYCGSKFAVAVESGTAAIFLSLMYKQPIGVVEIPKRTYPSVPMQIIHAGGTIKWSDKKWKGEYELGNTDIWDSALRFKKGMYHGGFQCLSFHVKKHLPIGRGGMILTDNPNAYTWLRKARFDGRDEVPLEEFRNPILGWNMYMTPEQAVRGMMLFNTIKNKKLIDMDMNKQGYPDLSKFAIFKPELLKD